MARPTVIFDLGGVLVGFDFLRACRRLEAAGGLPAGEISRMILGGDDKRRLDTGLLTPQDFAARICAASGARLEFPEFKRIWCDIFFENTDVTSLLDEIGKRADLLLLSNTDPMHLDYVRREYGFLGKFRALVLSYEAGCAKPDPAIFLRAVSLCAPGSSAIYFDDIAEFVDAARRQGLEAEQFVGAQKLKYDLQRFGVL